MKGRTFKISDDGTVWWYNDGKRRRSEGTTDGSKEWYNNGKRHRTDVPIIKNTDGHKEYCIDGVKYTEEEFAVIGC